MTMDNSLEFAQGAKTLRKEDHSGMIDCYLSRVENGELHLKKKISKEEMVAMLPPRVDFSKQAL
jgi:branched-chain amino acid transport system substrate-binding protein